MPFDYFQQGCAYYIRNTELLEDGDWVGVVTFNHVAGTAIGMTKINGRQSRENIASRLPYVADGNTSIGSGVSMRAYK